MMIGPIRLATLLFALGCSASATAETEEQTCKNECPAKKTELKKKSEKTVTRNQGLGESPGVSNLEFLGLGYNIFEGNPRGSESAKLDPGFRGRVVELKYDQQHLSIDQDYMVPFGVDFKYVTACNFDSKATELSSASQYQSELSKEVSQSNSWNLGASFPVSGALVDLSGRHAFTKSNKFKEFSENTKATQSVSFEAKALCSEFKASLEPYYEHKFRETFNTALKELAHPWENTDEQRAQYTKFFDAFGTHYVNDLTLGAKHIFTSEIKSDDVSDLSREEVDVASTLSWSVQASVGGGGGGGTGGISEEYGVLLRSESEEGGTKTYSYVFEKGNEDSLSELESLASPVSISGGYSKDKSEHSNTQTSSVNKVRSKVTAIHELNVGGNPPVDGNWKTWATTVRDRPMPIAYELMGIWNLMEDETNVEAFKNAILDIYKIDVRKEKDSSIIDALRFGVARGDGKAMSSYSREARSDYRSKLRLTSFKGQYFKSEVTKDIVVSSDYSLDVKNECNVGPYWTSLTGPSEEVERFACGMVAEWDLHHHGRGITGLSIIYCALDDWKNKEFVNVFSVYGSHHNSYKYEKMCDDNQYIIGAKVKVDTTTFHANEGINGLWIRCGNVPKTNEEVKETEHKVVERGSGDVHWQSKRSKLNTFLKRAKVRYCNEMGIVGLILEYSEPERGGRKYATYEYDISRENDAVAAIFASTIRGNVGKNTQEDEDEAGFTSPSKVFGKHVLNVLSYYPFGLMEKKKTKIVIQDFKDQVVRSNELQSFSFLSARNLPKKENYVAGIVHPDGYIVNESFLDGDVGFEVSKESKREFRIKFSGDNSVTHPTFVAFPLWFPRFENKFPSSIGDVVIATQKCDERECLVTTGTNDEEFASNFLGFSFVALNGDLESKDVSGIVHGKVTIKDNGNDAAPEIDHDSSQLNGFTVEEKFTTYPEDFTDIGTGTYNGIEKYVTAYGGGILITFDKAFQGLPSVIVNPIVGEMKDERKWKNLDKKLKDCEKLKECEESADKSNQCKKLKESKRLDECKESVEKMEEDKKSEEDKKALVAGSKIDHFSLPYAVVDHITSKSAFIKVNWVDTIQDTFEFLSFHIIVVGPQQDPFVNHSPDTEVEEDTLSEEE